MSGSQGLLPGPDQWACGGPLWMPSTAKAPCCFPKTFAAKGFGYFVRSIMLRSNRDKGNLFGCCSLALAPPGRLSFLMAPGAGLPWREDIASLLGRGPLSSCVESAAPHITNQPPYWASARRMETLALGFFWVSILHILVCPAGFQRGSSDIERGSATVLSLGKLEQLHVGQGLPVQRGPL